MLQSRPGQGIDLRRVAAWHVILLPLRTGQLSDNALCPAGSPENVLKAV